MKKKYSSQFSSLFTYFVMLMCFLCIRMIFSLVNLPFSDGVNDLIVTIIIQVGVMFCISLFLFSFLTKTKPRFVLKEFGYTKISVVSVLICILIGIVCYFLNIFIASFFNSVISLMGYENLPSSRVVTTDYSVVAFILQVVTVAILPAFCEETAHRGLLLKGMSSMGIIKALVFSSLLFGLMHMNINQFFYATALGFIMGLSVVVSKSIWPGIIIHFMNNFLSTYFSFASNNNWLFGDTVSWFSSFMYGDGSAFGLFLRSLILLTVGLGVLVVLFVALLKYTRVRKVEKMLHDISQINKEYGDNPSSFNGNGEFENLYVLNKIMGEYNIKSLGSMVFTELESKYNKPSIFEKICLVSCIVLGSLATLSTFIWGIL